MPIRVAMLGMKGIPAKGGPERVVEALAVRLQEHDVSTTVYCGRYYTPAMAAVKGVRLIRIPTLPGKYLRPTSLDLLAALHAVLLSNYDLIHLHNSEASFVLPLLRLRYRVLGTRHGAAYWWSKWGRFAKVLLRATDMPFAKLSSALTSVSLQDAREMSRRFGRQVVYIPNGIGSEYQPDHQAAKAILRQHGIESGNYVLFAAGRIDPAKGAHLAIAAVNRLGDDAPPMLVVGDDSHHPQYSQELRRMAGPNIRFQAFVANPESMFGLMAGARCLIFPSTTEAMAMVLLEAASESVPVLCSDIPPNREVMGDNATYFASGNADMLAERLRWVLQHGDEAQAAARRACDYVHSELTWDLIVSRYAELYRTLAASHHARPNRQARTSR